MEPQLTSPTYRLDELAALAGLPVRTVRYYIQLELVDRPVGETRAAHYTAAHLGQLLAVRRWTEAGVSLERIRALLQQPADAVAVPPPVAGTVRVRTHLTLADGVELVIDPERAGLDSTAIRTLFQSVLQSYQSLRTDKESSP